MEDLVSMCERRCRKACNLCSAAEDSDEPFPLRQQWRTGPALPEARVTQVRGKGRRGYGHGPQPGQAVGIRGALRGLSDSPRATFGAGDVRADRQGAYGP